MGKHLESNPEKCGDVIGGFLHKGVMIMNARIQRYASFASYIWSYNQNCCFIWFINQLPSFFCMLSVSFHPTPPFLPPSDRLNILTRHWSFDWFLDILPFCSCGNLINLPIFTVQTSIFLSSNSNNSISNSSNLNNLNPIVVNDNPIVLRIAVLCLLIKFWSPPENVAQMLRFEALISPKSPDTLPITPLPVQEMTPSAKDLEHWPDWSQWVKRCSTGSKLRPHVMWMQTDERDGSSHCG